MLSGANGAQWRHIPETHTQTHTLLQSAHLAFYKSSKANITIIKTWAQDLGVIIDEVMEADIWEHANNIPLCNRAKKAQFKLLHCLQISPELSHKMDPK